MDSSKVLMATDTQEVMGGLGVEWGGGVEGGEGTGP